MNNLSKEAIADAKAVRETALANAKFFQWVEDQNNQ